MKYSISERSDIIGLCALSRPVFHYIRNTSKSFKITLQRTRDRLLVYKNDFFYYKLTYILNQDSV